MSLGLCFLLVLVYNIMPNTVFATSDMKEIKLKQSHELKSMNGFAFKHKTEAVYQTVV